MSEPESIARKETCTAACLCGAVRLRITHPVSACVHCHCTMCQRAHGSGYITWIALPSHQVTFEQGEDDLTRYASSSHGSRSFCRQCGSILMCQIDERPEEIDIPLANLEPGNGIEPQLHIYFDDRAEWTRVADELPRLGGTSGLENIEP